MSGRGRAKRNPRANTAAEECAVAGGTLFEPGEHVIQRIVAATLVLSLVACGPHPRRSNGGEMGPTGSYAKALLGDGTFTKLIVTVDHVAGRAPSPAALAHLQRRLAESCRKPEGVVVELGAEIPPLESGVYSAEDIRWLATAYRRRHSEGRTASIYVLYLDGRTTAAGADRTFEVIAVAIAATCFAVFKDSIASEASVAGARPENLETTALLHETGHLLGLVGLGTPAQTAHADTHHAWHCLEPTCAMSWLMTGANAGSGLSLDAIGFDAACRADLRANGGL